MSGPESPHCTLVQFTDLHVGVEGPSPRYGVDPFDVLERALQAVAHTEVAPAALLFTGDLTEHGLAEEYRRLRSLVEPAAARAGVPAVWVAGNHDDRAALRTGLLDEAADDAPLDHVVRLGDLRIVVLDSTVPCRGYGRLSAGQLDRLRAELAEPAPAGTVLALHHPPVPAVTPLTAAIALQHREELAEVLAGTDVRIVLAGHTHAAAAGVVAGIPVWTGGPIATVIDALAPAAGMRVLAAPSVSRIDLFPDTVLATTVPVDAPVVRAIPAPQLRRRVAELRAELPAG